MKKRKAPLSGRGLVAARRSRIHGSGVFALRNIRKGQEIVHYLGKLRTHEDVDETYTVANDDGHTFYFRLNDKYVVDAARGGNVARWINHSCRPNCEAVTEEDPSRDPRKDRILIQAIRDIAAGDELSYDYGILFDGPVTTKEKTLWACRCGAPNCKGMLLEPRKGGRATAR